MNNMTVRHYRMVKLLTLLSRVSYPNKSIIQNIMCRKIFIFFSFYTLHIYYSYEISSLNKMLKNILC